jgi:hypothetical protein
VARLGPEVQKTASQSEKTSSHPRSPKPTEDRSGPAGSADLEPLFSGVFGIGALYPAFGPLPAHPKPCQCRPDALGTDLSSLAMAAEVSFEEGLTDPEGALFAELARGLVEHLP